MSSVPPWLLPPGAVVSIDPGKRRCGVALWVDGLLASAWLAAPWSHAKGRAPAAGLARAVVGEVVTHVRLHVWRRPDVWPSMVDWLALGPRVVDAWVIEDQADYEGHDGRAHDLRSLRAVVTAIRSVPGVAGVVTVRPYAWKANVPKHVHRARMKSALSRDELARVADPLSPDCWDAIGLGLWALARTGRGGTRIPRAAHGS